MSDSDSNHSRAITLLSCAALASMASIRVCDPLLPQLAHAFKTSTGHAAQTISGFAVAYGLLQIFYGYLGDRFGKYMVITAATLACTFATLGAALAASLGWLVFFRVLCGATASGIIPLSMAWIGDTVPYARRQATLARFLMGTILGLISGQFIGGFFADTIGWRWAFVLLAAVFGFAGALLWGELRRDTLHQWRAESAPAASPQFVRRIAEVLSTPWTRTVLVAVFFEGLAGFATLAFIPAYLHSRFELSLTAAGAVVGLFGLGALCYTLVARQLVATLAERGLALGGGLLASAAFVLLLAGPVWSWAIPACFAAGLGFYMLHNTLQTHATQMAPQARGTAVALFAVALFFGQSAGVLLAARVIETAGPAWLFAIAAVALLATGIGFSQALHRRHLRFSNP